MEFNRLLSSVISLYGEIDFKKTVTSHKNVSTISNKNYFLITKEEDLKKWLIEAEENGEMSIDT